MAEIRLFTSNSRAKEGTIAVTAHLEPEGDGTHEKVIAQAKADGFILPPGTWMSISTGSFYPDQEARIIALIHSIVDPEINRLDGRIDNLSPYN